MWHGVDVESNRLCVEVCGPERRRGRCGAAFEPPHLSSIIRDRPATGPRPASKGVGNGHQQGCRYLPSILDGQYLASQYACAQSGT